MGTGEVVDVVAFIVGRTEEVGEHWAGKRESGWRREKKTKIKE